MPIKSKDLLHLHTDEQVRLAEMNDLLRFALNELKAIDGGEEIPSDRTACAKKLRKLADRIEMGDICPDANAIISEMSRLPIQR